MQFAGTRLQPQFSGGDLLRREEQPAGQALELQATVVGQSGLKQFQFDAIRLPDQVPGLQADAVELKVVRVQNPRLPCLALVVVIQAVLCQIDAIDQQAPAEIGEAQGTAVRRRWQGRGRLPIVDLCSVESHFREMQEIFVEVQPGYVQRAFAELYLQVGSSHLVE